MNESKELIQSQKADSNAIQFAPDFQDDKRVATFQNQDEETEQGAAVFYKDLPTESAAQAFGIKYLYPWQRIVIANILDGAQAAEQKKNKEDCDAACDRACTEGTSHAGENTDVEFNGRQIVLLPTGAGKSLCFLTPALLLKGPTMVLYPLLALMADQKRRMDEGNLESVVFMGGQTAEEREENFRRIKAGAKIILANPEVLQSQELVDRLSKCNISHIAIDEAHCVSEWGDSFRPAYLTLGKIIQQLNVPVVTAFTATASPQVLDRVSQVLFGGQAHIIRSDSDRPNIHYNVINAYSKKREAFRLAVELPKPLIVFCGTRNKSEDMARELAMYLGSDKVRFYHAGMEKSEKTEIEQWFYGKKDGILCCTCAYGMGVDKKDIKTVIHYEVSASAEAYIQEAGRAARDGSVAEVYLIWSQADSLRASRFPKGSRNRVLMEFAQSTTCRREVLLNALGDQLTYCDGCDVCRRKAPAPPARDAQRVLSYVAKNRKCYSIGELCRNIQIVFNRQDKAKYGRRIWEFSDVREIVVQLLTENKLRQCIWPWNGRITCSLTPGKATNAFFHGKFWKFLEEVNKKAEDLKKNPIHLLQLNLLHRHLQQEQPEPVQQELPSVLEHEASSYTLPHSSPESCKK